MPLRTLQTAAAATGNGTAQSVVGYGSGVFSVTGTFVGTVTFEATADDTNWDAIDTALLGASPVSSAVVQTASAPGRFKCSLSGFSQIRARVSAWTSGTITVTVQLSAAAAVPRSVLPATLGPIVFGVAGAVFTSADVSGSDAAITDAPTTGLRLYVSSVLLSSDTTLVATLKEETAGTQLGKVYLAANSSYRLEFPIPLRVANVNHKLMLRTNIAGNVSALAFYTSAP